MGGGASASPPTTKVITCRHPAWPLGGRGDSGGGQREKIVEDVKRRAMDFVDQNAGLIRQLALDIHARPESNYQEFYASGRASELLEEFACDVVRGLADFPTAFAATIRGSRDG